MLGAAGVGVSDIKKSLHFYRDVLQIGLQIVATYDVETYYEELLGFAPGTPHAGSPIILMEYKDKSLPKPQNQLGKFVFYVEDVKAVVERCRKNGNTVVLDVGQAAAFPDIAMVADPDGFVVEFIPQSLHWSKQVTTPEAVGAGTTKI